MIASVIGLGKLGSPLAAVLASRGLTVIGADTDPAKVAALAAGRAPVVEPGLQELIDGCRERLSATTSVEDAAASSEISYVIVPTPSDDSGGFSLDVVLAACEPIGRAIAAKPGRHTVVIVSTVMPGDTGGPVREALERASGRRCGDGFGLAYSPEFIALGDVVRGLLEPDLVLVGEADAASGDLVERLARATCVNGAPVARMQLVEAEIAKLSVNAYVTTKITFANMLARLCERHPGAAVDVVTEAMGLDRRVGRAYLRGAVAYGGPCFPRDNRALAEAARRAGTDAPLAVAVDAENRRETGRLADRVEFLAGPGATVGVLGLAYKPGTEVVEASAGLLLAAELAARGVAVVAHDPLAAAGAARELPPGTRVAASAAECIAAADIVVLATPWPEYARLGARELGRSGEPRIVVDCWRLLDGAALAQAVRYVAIGMGETA